ncbi:MAG TPA: GNAT family N-acetyltransferase [Tepidiformaceae bacterium]|nr:GNAT family N-acetyltransferase [Tepidiformaceae bacterium]
MTIRIEELRSPWAPEIIGGLAGVLADCVEGGASVSFMWPLPVAKAAAFWAGMAARAANGEAFTLAAWDGEVICGTVTLALGLPENQPHRADVTKLLVHRSARGRGIGERLMGEIERIAAREGKSLLVLDTASPAAEHIYRKLGWNECGVIPGYALNPDGMPCATTVFWKQLAL